MNILIEFDKDETDASYYMFSYILENGFEFLDEDSWMNKPFKRAFDKIASAYENMHKEEKKPPEGQLK